MSSEAFQSVALRCRDSGPL